MNSEPNEFDLLVARVAQHDQEAARQLIHLYGDNLLRYIRFFLKKCPILRSQLDSDFVGNGVWAEVFFYPGLCELYNTPAKFVQFLMRVAATHMDRYRKHYLKAEKRDLRRRKHLSDPQVAEAAASLSDKSLTSRPRSGNGRCLGALVSFSAK
jgi:hypothetical protein